jgi:O-succinylbenzoate synthase
MSRVQVGDILPLAHVVSIPLTTPFRGLNTREALLFQGPEGPAEWSPFLEYDDAEAATWLRAALEQSWDKSPPAPATVRVNGTIPAVPAQSVAGLLAGAGMPTTVKVKVGGPGTTLVEDVARVSAVRDALGPTGRIRLDANGSWTLDEAEHAIREMELLDLDYIEQPVSELSDMAELRRRITRLGIQVAADESIRRLSDIDAVIAAGACDVVVLKVQPLGGLEATQRVAEKALSAGLEVVVSSALETSVGLYRGAQMVGWLEGATSVVLDAGLGTQSFLAEDVVRKPLFAQAGLLEITPPVLDEAKVFRLLASAERTDWWHQRLERCVALV